MEEKIAENFNIQDGKIFLDLKNYRQHDSHKLLKRLDVIHKNINSSITKSENKCINCDTVQSFLRSVISCYCCCIESIKLARSVEKLLHPWISTYKVFIREEFRKYVDSVTAQGHPKCSSLVAVSNLLEQNTLVQGVVELQLTSFLTWLSHHLNTLVSKPQSELYITEAGCLYAYVKIALQLFQSCAKSTCGRLWCSGGDKEDANTTILSQIIRDLYVVLERDGYASDCVQLTGTTFSLALVAASDPASTTRAFWSTFNYLNAHDSEVTIEKIRGGKFTYNSCKVRQSLGALSLVKGIVVCSGKDVMHYQDNTENLGSLDDKGDNPVPFLSSLFPVICQYCEGPIKLNYHAFTLLQSWYRKFVLLISSDNTHILTRNGGTEVFEKTLNLIFLNWDSPVEDVPDIIVDVFKLLLEVWNTSAEKDIDKNIMDVPSAVLEKLMNIPWYIKGKYKLFAAVLPYVGDKQILSKNPEIKQQLLHCLSTNYLAPCASDVYRAFLQYMQQRSKEESWIEVWRSTWLDTVMQGLTSTDSLVRSNMNHYWVQSTIKILPPVGQFLQDHLCSVLQMTDSNLPRQRVLHAWVVVSKVSRTHTGVEIKESGLLREALYHNEEDIRADGIGLLCCSLKKAEPLSERDSCLLCETLPYSLKVDSAPFRQHLAANMKKLLVRVRDSCLAMLKSKSFEDLDISLDFIEWLLRLCIDNLLPGSCYQRRKACLDLLSVLFDTMTYQENAKQRKAFTPENVKSLEGYVQKKQMWDFYSFDNAVCLLHCVSDGADEIQELAADLLMRYFPWPLSPDKEPVSKALHLLSHALKLCNSPKAYESQSGALLCKIVFIKYVVEKGWTFEMDFNNLEFSCDALTVPSSLDTSPAVHFLGRMLQFIQGTLSTSQTNVVQAAKESPIHGLVTACTRCLTETTELFQEFKVGCDLDQTIISLIKTNMEIISTMLKVMARDSKNESCPSFAEIGIALENWIAENQSEYTETTSLSAEHQYLLSWCWINIKESCLSIGQLTSYLLRQTGNMDLSLIKDISAVFLRVLNQCRHRGVIEGCRSAFIRFISALFDTPDTKFNQLPQQILQEALESLESKALATSVTRKSAGLPIIIQTIVSCERKCKRNILLQGALSELFRIAHLPLDLEIDERHDLPQVHGLNILKSLYGDASLTASLMPYVGKAVQIVVNSFSSPAWSIRNAATRLFSALVTRIFGHKKTTEDSRNSITLPEFAAHYPELPPFMLEHLDKALMTDISAIDKLHPSLFPVLTLLASLSPTEVQEGDKSSMNEFSTRVRKLIGSPVYYLRHLTASAFVALVPLQEGAVTMAECLNDIPETTPRQDNNQSNSIHGNLLCLEKMLMNHKLSVADGETLLKELLRRDWIFSDISMCSLVKDVYLSVVMKLLPHGNADQQKAILDLVSSVENIGMSGRVLLIGSSVLCKRVVKILFQLQVTNGEEPELEDMLTHTDIEVRLAAVTELSKLLESNTWNQKIWNEVQRLLLQSVTRETHPPLIDLCLSLVTNIHLQYGTEPDKQELVKQVCSSRKGRIEDRGSVTARVLTLTAVDIQHEIQRARADWDIVESWSQQVLLASTMTGDEHCRMAAAQGILITGQTLLTSVGHSRETTKKEKCAVQLIQACLNLVQDDDTDVRDVAIEFMSKFKWETKSVQYKSIQCNFCFQLFLDYISDTFWWSEIFLVTLLDMLYRPGEVRQCVAVSTSHQQLFEQEDNSFFAERIFNGFMIFQTIQRMVTTAVKELGVIHLRPVADLCDGMGYIVEILQSEDRPVFSICSDSSVLAAVSGCILLSTLYIDSAQYLQKSDAHLPILQQHLQTILQKSVLPPAFKKKVSFLVKT